MGRGDTHHYLLPRKEVRFGAHQFWLSSLLLRVTVLADTGSGDAPGWPFPHLGRHRGLLGSQGPRLQLPSQRGQGYWQQRGATCRHSTS